MVNVFNQVTPIQTAGITTPFAYADADNTERTTSGATTYSTYRRCQFRRCKRWRRLM